jgi:hypothetical protein
LLNKLFCFHSLCLQINLRHWWKMGLTALRSSFPSARRGGTSKELHSARSC